MKCPKHKVDSASHRAVVMVCPECGRILDSGELLRLLKRLGFSKGLVKQVQTETRKKISPKSHSRSERTNNT